MNLISSRCRKKVHVQQTITVIPQMLHFSFSANVDTRILKVDGFGGLVVSMLASGTQVCGFKPCRSRWIFRA